MKKAIIIGAGPAGLTAAYELLTKTDIIPYIIEADRQVGGLAKTIDYKGNKIDIGGHRFFSKSKRVIDWWLHFLPLEKDGNNDAITIQYQQKKTTFSPVITAEMEDQVMMIRPRKSRIYYHKKFFDYPLQINRITIRNLGFIKMIRIGTSYIKARLFPLKKEDNLAQLFTNRFGKELYETFFKDYTEKVWGVPCEKIPASWGQQRVKDLNILKVLWHAVQSVFKKDTSIGQTTTSTSLIEQFLYPKYGPGQMWETVASEIKRLGGEIFLNCTVTQVSGQDNCLRSISTTHNSTGEKTEFTGDYFFSSMPVKELAEGLSGINIPSSVLQTASSLDYRDFLITGLLVSELTIKESRSGERIKDNWIYIQDNTVKAGRLQVFNNWSPFMVKNNKDTWIGIEYFCLETDAFWQQSDDAIKETAIQEMERIGILQKEKVKDAVVIKVKKAYPSYYGSYERFEIVQRFFDSIENLFLVGRNGMHRYNNSDHSMLTAMTAVENIINGRKDKSNIWEINTEEDYHEE